MKKLRISAVSYLNTKPFIYGLKNSGLDDYIELMLDFPSECAAKLAADEADVGLIPSGVIPGIKETEIISNYCIGSSGSVRTVVLASEVPLDKIKTILLDSHSRTSVLLARILSKQYWRISPVWVNGDKDFEKNSIKGTTAGVVIGDKVFGIENRYQYVYDLSREWKDFTDNDFVFACWTANKAIPEEFKEKFNEALKFGVDNISNVIEENELLYPNCDIKGYFMDNICFSLNESKMKGMDLFWKYIKKLEY